MEASARTMEDVLSELALVHARLEEAEETIAAIRGGEVDAFVVRGKQGDQVFTLQGADEPYRIFVEGMQEGAVTLDSQGKILYCNRAFSDMLGEPLERVIGTHFDRYLSLEDGNTLTVAEFSRVDAILAANGRSMPVLCSSAPIDIHGPIGFAVTVTDLSAQKEQEAELRRKTAELEGFCYSISHDLRTPLRSMIGLSRIVVEDFSDALPEEGRAQLRRIEGSASFMGRLIDDLLTYARLATQPLAGQQVNMSALAAETAATVVAHGFGVVRWEIEQDLWAYGDPRLIAMALQNLFANAAKFSAGRPNPTVRFSRRLSDSAFVVEDNGIGFSMDYVHKLFLPFERLHRQEDYAGTGIGLANVHRIVQRHGGKVWAEAVEGEGAKFYFTLQSRP